MDNISCKLKNIYIWLELHLTTLPRHNDKSLVFSKNEKSADHARADIRQTDFTGCLSRVASLSIRCSILHLSIKRLTLFAILLITWNHSGSPYFLIFACGTNQKDARTAIRTRVKSSASFQDILATLSGHMK